VVVRGTEPAPRPRHRLLLDRLVVAASRRSQGKGARPDLVPPSAVRLVT
jgi:hypothetical protein